MDYEREYINEHCEDAVYIYADGQTQKVEVPDDDAEA